MTLFISFLLIKMIFMRQKFHKYLKLLLGFYRLNGKKGAKIMIMRIWHGVTLKSKSDNYFDYMMKTGVKMYRSLKGNQGVYVLRRIYDRKAEFLLLSLWDYFNSIRQFAGTDIEKAVYCFPEDKEFLLELEPCVKHYEVLAFFNEE